VSPQFVKGVPQSPSPVTFKDYTGEFPPVSPNRINGLPIIPEGDR